MSLKKDIMEKMADSMMKMDKDEKKEFLKYVIDSIGESFFEDLTKEEKAALMTDALRDIIKKSGLTDMEQQKELVVSLTQSMVDCFLGELKADEKGEIITSIVSNAIEKVGPEIRSAIGSSVKMLMEASPTIGEALIRVLRDPNMRTVLRDFIKGLFLMLKDLLKSMAIEVYGYLKESGPEVMEFLKNAARTALKALVRIGVELLKKAIEVLSELMQAGGRSLIHTKDWIDKVMASDELKSLKGTMDRMVDEKSERVKQLLAEGVVDMEELVKRTEMPRETLRNLLLKLWERGEVEMDNFKLGKPSAG